MLAELARETGTQVWIAQPFKHAGKLGALLGERATQSIEGTLTYGVSEQLAELLRENANGTLGSEIARRAALPSPNSEKPH